jgi:hypothetical protein
VTTQQTKAESRYAIHLAPRTWGAGEGYLDIPVDIRLVKDDIDRYAVTLRFSGQVVGYVWRSHTSDSRGAYWKAGISNSAYYPADADVMTALKVHDSHPKDWHELEVHPVSSRYDGVQEILFTLGHRAAASVESLVEKARRPFIIAQAEAGKREAEHDAEMGA